MLPLLGNHNPQQLLLQALWGDHEIEQRHLGGQFWEVVWVPQFSGDIEAEIAGVFDHTLPQPDAVHTTWVKQKMNDLIFHNFCFEILNYPFCSHFTLKTPCLKVCLSSSGSIEGSNSSPTFSSSSGVPN